MLARTGTLLGLLATVTLGTMTLGSVGCSDSEAPSPVAEATSADAVEAPPALSRPSNPIAAAAYDFLDAVFAGDTERADRLLTPAAAKQLAASGQRFAPPGSGPSGFTIGEVRTLDSNRAAVECFVRGEIDGQPAEEALGCLLKRVEGRWAISGIAYEISPGEPPTVFDFERAPRRAQQEYVANPGIEAPAARTAADPSAPLTR